jgi:hypothetical protein
VCNCLIDEGRPLGTGSITTKATSEERIAARGPLVTDDSRATAGGFGCESVVSLGPSQD